MKSKINELYSNNDRINVISYNKLTAEIAKEINAKYILRGLRNTTDFEFENSISQINRDLNKNLETVFLITSPDLAPISSTIIRDVKKCGLRGVVLQSKKNIFLDKIKCIKFANKNRIFINII